MENGFDVIIVGGSYAGLAAGMALGRSLRKVLIIDGGKPCNIQTPHSHNFITQDGKTPAAISAAARKQVEAYPTVHFLNAFATQGLKTKSGFDIALQSGEVFSAKKLVFATGVKDLMPAMDGFSACWGISIIHCPYCHGYEVKGEKTGVLLNGDMAFEFSKLINNWTKDLTILTNGKSTLDAGQTEKLKAHNIQIIEHEIESFEHTKGQLNNLVFKNGTKMKFKAVYAKIPFAQHSDIPAALGCELTENGYIQVDGFQKTTVPGVYACGDNTVMMRSVANAVAMGTLAGAMVNKELVDDEF